MPELETGNNSFQQDLEPLAEQQDNFVPVPLPTEIPSPPNFSSLPDHILHSGTVETLIGQNEDLMARLKVNLRRNSLLEQQIMEHERLQRDIKSVNDALQAQIQVLIEKDKIWKDKNQRIEENNQNLKAEMRRLENRMARLFRLEAFRRRIQKWIRPSFENAKAELKAEYKRGLKLTQDIQSRDALISDLRAKLSEAISHIQNQGRIYQKDQAQLVEQYEQKVREQHEEIERLKTDAQFYKERSTKLDSVLSRQVETENKVIALERAKQDVENRLQNQVTDLIQSQTQFKSDAQGLATELVRAQAELKEASTHLKAAQSAREEVQAQYESLQLLWSDAQRQLEESRLRQESLNKLNQELSRKFRDARKAQENQVVELPISSDKASEKIHQLDIEN